MPGSRNLYRRATFTASKLVNGRCPMKEEEQKQQIRVGKIESRRKETDRAFAEIMENERKQRVEKTMRLRQMRLVKH
jgi:hypothetical protein